MMEPIILTGLSGGGALTVIWFFAKRLVAALDRVTDRLGEHATTISAHSVRLTNMEREVFK